MKFHVPSAVIAYGPATASTADPAGVHGSKLVIIRGGLAVKVSLPDARKLLRIERYLARQARAAHNLGPPVLEHYLIRLTCSGSHLEPTRKGDCRLGTGLCRSSLAGTRCS